MADIEHRQLELEIEEIESFYGELQIIRNISLSVSKGETVAIFGPNGHGKSTLLKAIGGIHPPRTGRISYRGRAIQNLPSEKIVEMGISYIPEDRNLFFDMTVLENLTLGAYNRSARKKVKQNLEFVFALFPRLWERKNQSVSTLSGGESRMVSVGRGLMSNAALLLVDEPSIGLSPIMKKDVFNAIGQIKKELAVTLLIVEQEVDYPLQLADRIYLFNNGGITLEKKANEVSKEEIEKSYF